MRIHIHTHEHKVCSVLWLVGLKGRRICIRNSRPRSLIQENFVSARNTSIRNEKLFEMVADDDEDAGNRG